MTPVNPGFSHPFLLSGQAARGALRGPHHANHVYR